MITLIENLSAGLGDYAFTSWNCQILCFGATSPVSHSWLFKWNGKGLELQKLLNYVSTTCSNKFNYTSQIFQFVVSLTLKTATITQEQFWVQFTVLQLKVSRPHKRQSFCIIEIKMSSENWREELVGQWWYNFWSSITGHDALWGFSFQFNSILIYSHYLQYVLENNSIYRTRTRK